MNDTRSTSRSPTPKSWLVSSCWGRESFECQPVSIHYFIYNIIYNYYIIISTSQNLSLIVTPLFRPFFLSRVSSVPMEELNFILPVLSEWLFHCNSYLTLIHFLTRYVPLLVRHISFVDHVQRFHPSTDCMRSLTLFLTYIYSCSPPLYLLLRLNPCTIISDDIIPNTENETLRFIWLTFEHFSESIRRCNRWFTIKVLLLSPNTFVFKFVTPSHILLWKSCSWNGVCECVKVRVRDLHRKVNTDKDIRSLDGGIVTRDLRRKFFQKKLLTCKQTIYLLPIESKTLRWRENRRRRQRWA